ncbi:MAG: hypothetical protein LBD74_08215, partial [Spirochaetaceae bacterium]|nr:hypothetical protein [Spirochaetaceae bacterium]
MAKKSLLHHTAVLHYQRDLGKESDEGGTLRIESFPLAKSLLYRASQVKVQGVLHSDGTVPSPGQGAEGIDGKDVQEIQDQLEALNRKNRINLTAKELKISPTKNGVIFPLVVNGLLLGIAAGALIVISQMVTADKMQSLHDQSFSSVEGQLIQQMRQDSELQLSEKEREISAIRSQLASLKVQELTAARQYETRYTQRQQELQNRLKQDVNAERKRLSAKGISPEDTDALLAVYEQQQAAYYRAELEAYQVQLAEERDAAQANYQQLQNKFQQDLQTLNEERR